VRLSGSFRCYQADRQVRQPIDSRRLII
jgi:hypothetical protein